MPRDTFGVAIAIVFLLGLLGLYIGWFAGALSTDIDSDICGTVDYLPNKFGVKRQWFSSRRNMDVLENLDEANSTKIGEYYRKIISFPQHYRFVDKHNHIAATMSHNFFSYTHFITRCDSGVQYEIRQHFITWGLFETAYNLYRREHDNQEWQFIGDIVLETFLGRSMTITIPNTSKMLAEIKSPVQFFQESWTVQTHAPGRVEPYVAGFLAVLVTNEDIDRQNSRNKSGRQVGSTIMEAAISVGLGTKEVAWSVVGVVNGVVGAAKLAVGLSDDTVHPPVKADEAKVKSRRSLVRALVPAM